MRMMKSCKDIEFGLNSSQYGFDEASDKKSSVMQNSYFSSHKQVRENEFSHT